MIMGNWVDAEGNVAAIFNPEDDQDLKVDLKVATTNGNYELGTEWRQYWYYDEADNLYYYKEPLVKGESTKVKLFNRFTNPINRTNEGLFLDFVVLVQAVEADAGKASVKAAWGDAIANILTE
jgi:hypothetical protein